MTAQESTSTRPYLLRALHEWCVDNGFTPYVAVAVDPSVQVPREFVQDGQIVLNVSYDATSSLKIGNDFLEFKARFGGVPRDIMVPISRVAAIYARENGQGMAFPVESAALEGRSVEDGAKAAHADERAAPVQLVSQDVADGENDLPEPPRPPMPSGGTRPALKRIK